MQMGVGTEFHNNYFQSPVSNKKKKKKACVNNWLGKIVVFFLLLFWGRGLFTVAVEDFTR